MKTALRILVISLGVSASCLGAFSGASGAVPFGQTLSAQGVVVHLGIKQARAIKAQPRQYPELHVRGRIPNGRNDYYLFVALFETVCGERITDARVFTRVSPLGLAGPKKELEPLSIGGAITYGSFFKFDSKEDDVIRVEILRQDKKDHALASFEYRSPSSYP